MFQMVPYQWNSVSFAAYSKMQNWILFKLFQEIERTMWSTEEKEYIWKKPKNYKKLKEQKNEWQKEHISPSEDSSVSSTSLNVKHKCKGCLREFTRLVVHLEMKPDCLSKYYQRELEIYKRQKRNKKQKQCYNRKKMKTNEKEVGMKNQVVFWSLLWWI